MKAKTQKLKKKTNPSPRPSPLPQGRGSAARKLNRQLRRREAKILKRRCRPLATKAVRNRCTCPATYDHTILGHQPDCEMTETERGVALVLVDESFAKPFRVEWTPRGDILPRHYDCENKLEADFVLTLKRQHSPVLWVKVRTS